MKTNKCILASLVLTACFLLGASLASAQEAPSQTTGVPVGVNSLALTNENNGGVFYLAPGGTLTCDIINPLEWQLNQADTSSTPPTITLTSKGSLTASGNPTYSDATSPTRTQFFPFWQFTFQASATTQGKNILHFTLQNGNDIYFTVFVE